MLLIEMQSRNHSYRLSDEPNTRRQVILGVTKLPQGARQYQAVECKCTSENKKLN